MITLFLLFFFTYTIGFIAGYLLNRKEAEMLVEGIVERGKKLLPDNRLKPGIIRRPTAQELEKRNTPQEVKDAHDAMMETLDKIPELKKLRKEMENEHRKLEV